MWRASEAFKTEFLKNAYETIWTKNLNSKLKIKHNICLENLNFEINSLEILGGPTKRNMLLFVTIRYLDFTPVYEDKNAP